MTVHPGHRLFARYAHAPNSLGYCGPAQAAALQRVACGGGADVDVPRLARQFSGAWPYQLLLADLLTSDDSSKGDAPPPSPTGSVDPLSEEVGRAYWTGSALTDRVDHRAYGEALLERFAGQAGHYWTHLTPELLDEVSPSHAFHVLGVYPWSRLLHTGLPEPLHVLDSCRIRAGRVLDLDDESVLVEADTLTWDGRVLGVADPREERVERRTADGTFTGELGPGDHVAIHWGFACDTLTEDDVAHLRRITSRQVTLTADRLEREA